MQDHKKPHRQPPQTPSHPTHINTPEEWKEHWRAQGQDWRTEPEISAQRQTELTQRRALKPDEEKGIYPFGGVKLDRADIEWLLATHENGRGPVLWSDETQHERKGLDLRGADLRGDETQKLNLEGLPLSQLIGGNFDSFVSTTLNEQAAIHLEGAHLIGAHLERATFIGAQLEGADLSYAQLEGAHLTRAHLERADLTDIHLADTHHIGPFFADSQLGGGKYPETSTAFALKPAHLPRMLNIYDPLSENVASKADRGDRQR